MIPRKCWIVVMGSILMGAVLLGCHAKKSVVEQEAIRNQRRQLLDKDQQLFDKYLQGDVAQARKSLKESVRLMEDETILTPFAHAAILTMDYYHLYVLERRVGNEPAADVYWIKGRDWRLKAAILEGVPAEKAKERIKSYDVARIMEEIDDADKAQNNGNLPKYLQYIHKR